jgi:hypothetical protein
VPGEVFVIEGVGSQAAVEDADEPRPGLAGWRAALATALAADRRDRSI